MDHHFLKTELSRGESSGAGRLAVGNLSDRSHRPCARRGPDGISNVQARQLADRTSWLKLRADELEAETARIEAALSGATGEYAAFIGALEAAAEAAGLRLDRLDADFPPAGAPVLWMGKWAKTLIRDPGGRVAGAIFMDGSFGLTDALFSRSSDGALTIMSADYRLGLSVGRDGVRTASGLIAPPLAGFSYLVRDSRYRAGVYAEEGGPMTVAAAPPPPPPPPAERSLWRFRAALAGIREGGTTPLRVGLVGDSRAELPPLTAALMALLGERVGETSMGYRKGKQRSIDAAGATLSESGWTLYDGSSLGLPPYGCGPDGHALWTANPNATLKITHPEPVDSYTIIHAQHGGSWRYRLDGGPWTSVAADASGSLATVEISGLAATGHALDIDTTGNAGIVCITGLLTKRAGAKVEVYQLGNNSLRSDRWTQFLLQIALHAPLLPPLDLMIVDLRTNDVRTLATTPPVYIAALSQLVQTWRAAHPGLGFAFAQPPETVPETAATPFVAYRDALRDWTTAEGHLLLDLLDLWPPYTQSYPGPVWADDRHPNAVGSRLHVDLLNMHILQL